MVEQTQAAPELSFTDDDMKAAVAEITAIEIQSLRQSYLAVAAVVLKRFFRGDYAVWNEYSLGSKAIPALAERLKKEDSSWTEPRLYSAMRLGEQNLVHGGLDRWPRLSVEHFRILQSEPFERQRQLLDQASAEHLSSRQLRALVKGDRPSRTETEASVAEALQGTTRYEKLLAAREDFLGDLDRAEVPDEALERFKATLGQLETQLGEIRSFLKERRKSKAEAPANDTPSFVR